MLKLDVAGPDDAGAIASLRRSVADDLTRRYGHGHWSNAVTEKGVVFGMRRARVLKGTADGEIVGVLTLGTRKPWAIDPEYFTSVASPLYLTDMAVSPTRQGEGVGRWLLERAVDVARRWPADAVRLDAYDADAGSGGFYARCGFVEVGRVIYRGNPLIYFEKLLAAADP